MGWVTLATMLTFTVLLCALGHRHSPLTIILPTFGVFLGGTLLWVILT